MSGYPVIVDKMDDFLGWVSIGYHFPYANQLHLRIQPVSYQCNQWSRISTYTIDSWILFESIGDRTMLKKSFMNDVGAIMLSRQNFQLTVLAKRWHRHFNIGSRKQLRARLSIQLLHNNTNKCFELKNLGFLASNRVFTWVLESV